MSTFNGEITEFPFIAVDYFKNNAKCYFLSHCHTDHLVGLSTVNPEALIYASPLSALFVRQKYPSLKNVRVLEIGVTFMIDLPEDEFGEAVFFNVTALSAGHCIGSVQFLFQKESQDVLYSGDFRLSLSDLKKIKILKETRRNFVIYIDSTFLNSSYMKFPSQTESANVIVELTKNFLKRSAHNKVHLNVPAQYGYEHLIKLIGERLRERVWVNHEGYSQISGISCHVTNNDREAKVFLKPKYNNKIDDSSNVLTLQLSAMFWQNYNDGPFVRQIKENHFRVCFATHSSCSEIEELLMYLKPQKVFPNVIPEDVDEKREMFNQLARIQAQYIPNTSSALLEANVKKRFSFGKIKRLK